MKLGELKELFRRLERYGCVAVSPEDLDLVMSVALKKGLTLYSNCYDGGCLVSVNPINREEAVSDREPT